MKLHFVKVNPVENMTIFVLDQVPRKEHIRIANKLMAYSSINAEQVAFIERSKTYDSLMRLQMMGGEFCGNASRSLAALMVANDYPQVKKDGDKFTVSLEVSGMDNPMTCQVKKTSKNNIYHSRIQMPQALSVRELYLKYELERVTVIRVDFPGIVHFIVDDNKIKDRDKFYNIIKDHMKKEKYDAFGIMYYDYEKFFMKPLVYVRATDTLFWERSCASGTAALAAGLSFLRKDKVSKEVFQPGGSLKVSAEYKNGKIDNIFLGGEVEIVAEGIAYI